MGCPMAAYSGSNSPVLQLTQDSQLGANSKANSQLTQEQRHRSVSVWPLTPKSSHKPLLQITCHYVIFVLPVNKVSFASRADNKTFSFLLILCPGENGVAQGCPIAPINVHCVMYCPSLGQILFEILRGSMVGYYVGSHIIFLTIQQRQHLKWQDFVKN